ncbi:MAG: hypothetical protein ACR2J8_01185 [Thermomicrobiales bacterium]
MTGAATVLSVISFCPGLIRQVDAESPTIVWGGSGAVLVVADGVAAGTDRQTETLVDARFRVSMTLASGGVAMADQGFGVVGPAGATMNATGVAIGSADGFAVADQWGNIIP